MRHWRSRRGACNLDAAQACAMQSTRWPRWMAALAGSSECALAQQLAGLFRTGSAVKHPGLAVSIHSFHGFSLWRTADRQGQVKPSSCQTLLADYKSDRWNIGSHQGWSLPTYQCSFASDRYEVACRRHSSSVAQWIATRVAAMPRTTEDAARLKRTQARSQWAQSVHNPFTTRSEVRQLAEADRLRQFDFGSSTSAVCGGRGLVHNPFATRCGHFEGSAANSQPGHHAIGAFGPIRGRLRNRGDVVAAHTQTLTHTYVLAHRAT